MPKNALIINGHQYWEISKGELNRSLVAEAQDCLSRLGWTVQTTVVADGYDIAAELDRLEWARVIIFQFPVFWYSVPWGLKKYIDTVFTSGRGRIYMHDGRSRSDPSRRYGSGGRLQGRSYMISVTWNAPSDVFGDPHAIFCGGTVDDVFLGLHVGMRFVGLEPLPTFTCHDVVKNGDPVRDIARFREHIAGHVAGLGQG